MMRDVFRAQAETCDGLGSTFTGSVLRAAADSLGGADTVATRLRSWTGDTSAAGQSVPLRLAGGLHALVLTGQDPDLAALYPPNARPDDADLRTAIAAAFEDQADHLHRWLDSPPQTNETGRAAVLIPAAALIATRFDLPLDLLELGASAGLNLRFDHFALDGPGGRLGAADAPLVLTPDWGGATPVGSAFSVRHRAGVDINPLDPTNAEDRLRLLSYVWPDQAARLARMRAALDIATAVPAGVTRADAADWLAPHLDRRRTGAVTLIYHTIAWQYFPPDTQARARAMIEADGAAATYSAPLAWLGFENDGKTPGAPVDLRLWPGDQSIRLGRADFHGRWIDWRG
jgi:hypothetical protein